MSIAKKIVSLRKTKGLSQEALAELAGINLRTIQRIENGTSVPRGFTLKALADALDKPLEEFVNEGAKAGVPKPGGENKNDVILEAQLINLSALTYLFLPYLCILIPYRLWRKKKHIPEVYELGKEVVNFQIVWTAALHISLLLTTAIQIFIVKYFEVRPWITVLHVFFIMYFLNAFFILAASIRLRKGSTHLYPNIFRIL